MEFRFQFLDHFYISLYPSDILFFGLIRMNSKSPIFTAQSDVALTYPRRSRSSPLFCTTAGRATISGIRHGASRNGETSSICSL